MKSYYVLGSVLLVKIRSWYFFRERDVMKYLNLKLIFVRLVYNECMIYRYVIVEWVYIFIELLKGFKEKMFWFYEDNG